MKRFSPFKEDQDVANALRGDRITLPGNSLINGIWPESIPLWLAAVYMALFIIRPWEQLFPWLADIHFERIYAFCMLMVVFFSKQKQFQMSLQVFAVLLFFGAVALSSLFAFNPSLAWSPLYEYTCLVIFYVILLLVIRKPYDLVFISICYIFAMGLYLAKSQWEFFIHGQHRYDMGVVRMVGIENTFGGPNALAMSIVVSLPIAVFLWSVRKEVTYEWPSLWKKWFPRFLCGYFLLGITSIILTNSRSGMVSLAFFILMLAARRRGIKRVVFLVLAVAVLANIWGFMPLENKNRLRTLWNPDAGPVSARLSAEGRKDGFIKGIMIFERKPVLGVGLGNFIAYRTKFIDDRPFNAHSLVGQLLAETGIAGGLTFLLMILVTLADCGKAINLSKGRSDVTFKVMSHLAVACRFGIILLVFEGLGGHNVFRFNWLWLAAFSSLAMKFSIKRLQELED